MVYGAIDERNQEWYTYLPELFDAIGNAQLNYNWLVTDSFCNIGNPVQDMVDRDGYCWISGEELTKLVEENHIQWIFAVLSGFTKDVQLSDVLEYPLPCAEYGGFWHLPVSMQHPLARIEIVPWDSTMTMIFSDDQNIIDAFRAAYPYSEDFETYLDRL